MYFIDNLNMNNRCSNLKGDIIYGKSQWEMYGHQVYFDGTYELDDDGIYILNMDGEAYSLNTQFEAEPVGDDLIVTGGLVDGELFVKQ